MANHPYRMLYSDIGGVLGTNGWDTPLRKEICSHFALDHAEIESRHRLMFDSYERGFLTFEEYLKHVFFASPRDFTWESVRDLTYAASTPWPENIDFFKSVKARNSLKVALISNEGQGITEHRITKFGLRELADYMVISHFTHLRKPDREIWTLALQLGGARPQESIYIDDREMFVSVAAEIGFTAVHHTSLDKTQAHLARLGLIIGREPGNTAIGSPS
jgi:putative hydrolase of the HAD superfamily